MPTAVWATLLCGIAVQVGVVARVLRTIRGRQGLRWLAACLGLVLVLQAVQTLRAG